MGALYPLLSIMQFLLTDKKYFAIGSDDAVSLMSDISVYSTFPVILV